MNEREMTEASAAELRLKEAEYFYEQFLRHSGPGTDNYFLMVAYFDAFLPTLTSVEEMVGEAAKEALRNNEGFRLLKALRNINYHHSVLAAIVNNSKFERPFSRIITAVIGAGEADPVKLRLRFDVLRAIFAKVCDERPGEGKTLDMATEVLNGLEQSNREIYLDEIMRTSLDVVAKNV